jgi:hypothetical protein
MHSFQSHNQPLHQCIRVIGRGGAAEALPVKLFSTYRYLELLTGFSFVGSSEASGIYRTKSSINLVRYTYWLVARTFFRYEC